MFSMVVAHWANNDARDSTMHVTLNTEHSKSFQSLIPRWR